MYSFPGLWNEAYKEVISRKLLNKIINNYNTEVRESKNWHWREFLWVCKSFSIRSHIFITTSQEKIINIDNKKKFLVLKIINNYEKKYVKQQF